MILSINIHPTRGGVAPLYNALGPSCRMVFRKQSKGPLNLPSDLLVVCIRILTVSTNIISTISSIYDEWLTKRMTHCELGYTRSHASSKTTEPILQWLICQLWICRRVYLQQIMNIWRKKYIYIFWLPFDILIKKKNKRALMQLKNLDDLFKTSRRVTHWFFLHLVIIALIFSNGFLIIWYFKANEQVQVHVDTCNHFISL